MRKLKIIAFVLLVFTILGIVGYNYIMYGGARNLATEEASFKVTSIKISTEFATNVDASNKKYLEKAVEIKGTITGINQSEIIIDNTIVCKLKNPNNSIKKNQSVTLRGRIIGYDDLMGELRLDQCLVL